MTARSHWLLRCSLLVALIGCFVLCLRQPAADAKATAQDVDNAIHKGVEFLKSQEQHGNWEIATQPADPKKEVNLATGGQYGGLTALATYALLSAGETPTTQSVSDGAKFLSRTKISGIYASGIRSQIWGMLPPKPEFRNMIVTDGGILHLGMRTKGASMGLFHYIAGKEDSYDHSVSQFGVLGMWALADAGYVVPDGFWQEADKAWRSHQLPDGSWCYMNTGHADYAIRPTATMTAAGVATLFITQDQLHSAEFLRCRGNITDDNIQRGLKWLGDNFAQVFTSRQFYCLYGVERIGVASGRKYLGEHNWYEEGAEWLLKHQAKDGSWSGGQVAGSKVPETAFAIVFLVRSRAGVIMNKVEYELPTPDGKTAEGPWNQRPRDLANLARWMGKRLERDFNWQSVTLKAPLADLQDAPILFVAGDKPLQFTDEQVAKLKAFIEAGGLILGNADCGNDTFAKSFVNLGSRMFPYEFRELPPNHLIYASEQFLREKWSDKPSVLGMSNGVRELMLLIPAADPSKAWQTSPRNPRDETFQLADDVYLYSVGQEFHTKDETYLIDVNPKVIATKTIKVARLSYPGNWDPEPGGWRRLAAIMHNQLKTDIQVEVVPLGQKELSARTHPVAHMTGTSKWKMTDDAIKELAKYVDDGGTLIVDAAGGSKDFADAAGAGLAAAFGGKPGSFGTVLPLSSALYTKGAIKIDGAEYRRFCRGHLTGKLNVPRIRGIEEGDRIEVFFSPEDLSAGLVGNPTDGIVGYAPGSAADLMADMILYAAAKR